MKTVSDFRADFPEFSSTVSFPATGVQFWLNFAYAMANPARFASQIDLAAELFAAHFISLEARNALEASKGGIPGNAVGVTNSKSVDRISIGYDTGAGTEDGAGHWNLTTYGTRYIWMTKMFGAGPLQIGIGTPPSGVGFGAAWPGPDTTPGFSNF